MAIKHNCCAAESSTGRLVAFSVEEDTTKDPRFKDKPLVVGAPGIRFYDGAPLEAQEGHVVGSLVA